MNKNILIHYARALYEVALEVDENLLHVFLDDLKYIRDVCDSNEDLKKFCDAPSIPYETKCDKLRLFFYNDEFKKVNKFTIVYLDILTYHGIFSYMHKIYRYYKHFYNQRFDVLEGIVYTSYKIDNKMMKKLIDMFEKKLSSKVDLRQITNPNLIGGINVVINDTSYNNSLDNMLKEVRKKVLGESK